MKDTIKEKYRAESIDEILELIEVDKKKYKASEQILKKSVKRSMPLFWKKNYVYLVEYNPETSGDMPKVTRKKDMGSDKDMILQMLNQESTTVVAKEESVEREVVAIEEKTIVLQDGTQKTEEKHNQLSRYKGQMLEAEIKAEFVEKIIEMTSKELVEIDYENQEKVENELIKQMTALMGDTYLMHLENMKRIVLIGPTGVGKTTTIGKIAGILKSQGKRVGFITTDVYRIGATHQLDIYAQIVNSTMETANTPKELEEAIYYFENVEKVDHILIDTVGRSPMDPGNVEDMKSYLEVSEADHVSLVLSCTQKEKDIYKIIDNFEKANVNSIVFTKLDETLNHGVIFNVLADKKAKVSFITNGQEVPQDLYIADTNKLAAKILRGVDDFERPSF